MRFCRACDRGTESGSAAARCWFRHRRIVANTPVAIPGARALHRAAALARLTFAGGAVISFGPCLLPAKGAGGSNITRPRKKAPHRGLHVHEGIICFQIPRGAPSGELPWMHSRRLPSCHRRTLGTEPCLKRLFPRVRKTQLNVMLGVHGKQCSAVAKTNDDEFSGPLFRASSPRQAPTPYDVALLVHGRVKPVSKTQAWSRLWPKTLRNCA